jgi:hypothetical protein
MAPYHGGSLHLQSGLFVGGQLTEVSTSTIVASATSAYAPKTSSMSQKDHSRKQASGFDSAGTLGIYTVAEGNRKIMGFL